MTRSRDLANLADGVEFLAADHTKLDGIEASATADQTDAEIRTAVEAASDSNVFTDADHSKLNAVEASATADQTNAEIRAAVEAASDSNVFTDADHSKLNAVEASADVTDATNVAAAGALMDSELTNLAAVKAINQSLVTTASPTFAGLATTANVTFGNNNKAIFGAGSDLQIYHDGSHSYISDLGTGPLRITTDGTGILLNKGTSESMGRFLIDGAVELYHDNVKKFETSATGIDVTGTVTADGLTVDGLQTINTSSSGVQPLLTLLQTNNTGGNTWGIDFKRTTSSAAEDLVAKIHANREGGDATGITFSVNKSNGNFIEAARFDSAGNYLVGKTANDIDTVGHRLGAEGSYAAHSRANEPALYVNRNSSDGNVLTITKDGSTVGSIGANSGQVYMADTAAGIRFSGHSTDDVQPCDGNGADKANVNLGASGNAWGDLFLSGGVRFSGAANSSVLDSYETGTFTPTYTSANGTITTSVNVGRYVKVGDMIHCNFNIRSTGVSSISGAIGITGMPYTAHSPSRASGSIWYMRSWGAALDNLRFGITGNGTSLSFYKHSANASVTSLNNGDFATGGDNNVLECSITYRTT